MLIFQKLKGFISFILLFFLTIISLNAQVNKSINTNSKKDFDEGNIEEREKWFYGQRAYPYPSIPQGVRSEAIRETKRMVERYSKSLKNSKEFQSVASTWEEVGPMNIGGRIRAIAVHPTQAGTLLIGAAAGGVWKTIDNGTNWTPIFDFQTAIAVNSIMYDPTNSNTIYVGTGEITSNVDSYLGDGLFKSIDEGKTWKNIGLTNVGAISGIAISPSNNKIIYVTSTKNNGGFYKSIDGGSNWKIVVSGNYFDMTVNPNNFNEVYISNENSVQKSIDGGVTFKKIVTGLTLTNSRRISISISPSKTTKVYALIARASGSADIGEVYFFNAANESWKLIYTLPNSFFTVGTSGQGWYDNAIAVHPKNDNVVLVGGIDVYRTNNNLSYSNVTNSYNGGNVHPDQHIIKFDPKDNKVVYLGNDGGIYVSIDTGKTWSRFSTKLAVTQYYKMDIDQTRFYRLYGGTQDNGSHGSFGTTSIVTDKWKSIYGGDGFYTTVDQADPNYVYAENFNGNNINRITISNTGSTGNKNMDPNGKINDDGAWSSPMAMSSVDKKSFYSGQTFLWRTRDIGTNWTKLSPGNGGKISAIGLSKFNAQRLLIGSERGEVAFSSDDGGSWTDSKGTPGRYCSEIEFDPLEENIVYAVFSGTGSGRVYISTDYGENFKDISKGLPNTPVNAIEINSANNQQLYIGTDVGVFASLDKGVTWFPFMDGLAIAPIVDLRIHKQQNVLYAASHGRSMWKVAIGLVKEPALLLYPVGGETFVTPSKILSKWSGFTSSVKISISLNGGETYKTLVESTLANYDSLQLPRYRTTRAKIKVEELTSNKIAESGLFSLSPKTNTSEILNRGFIIEAVAVKDNQMWSTVRDENIMLKWNLPLSNISKRDSVKLSNIPVGVKDMAYNNSEKVFYLLYSDNDYNNSKVLIMDTLGFKIGELDLPIKSISGIAMSPWGLNLITPGSNPTIYLVDKTAKLISQKIVEKVLGNDRRSLEFDESGFIQGVLNRDTNEQFRSEIQRIKLNVNYSNDSLVTLISSGINSIEFYGLTYYNGGIDRTKSQYICTDTAGVVRILPQFQFLNSVNDFKQLENNLNYKVYPNPAKNIINISLNSKDSNISDNCNLIIYNPQGDIIKEMKLKNVDKVNSSYEIDTKEFSSGLYYFVVTSTNGIRLSSPITIIK